MIIGLQDPDFDREIQRLFARSAELSRISAHLLADINAAYHYLKGLQAECQIYIENSVKLVKDIDENQKALQQSLEISNQTEET
jgi:hypothetical protein